MTIGERVKIIRKKLKLNGTDFGKLAGTSKQAVSNWENDINEPDGLALLALQREKLVNPDYILLGNGPEFWEFLPGDPKIHKALKGIGPKEDTKDQEENQQKEKANQLGQLADIEDYLEQVNYNLTKEDKIILMSVLKGRILGDVMDWNIFDKTQRLFNMAHARFNKNITEDELHEAFLEIYMNEANITSLSDIDKRNILKQAFS